jgi:hypothetical protein
LSDAFFSLVTRVKQLFNLDECQIAITGQSLPILTVRSREATFWTCFPRDRINAGAPSTARAEPKRALGRRLEVREIQLKNNKLPLSAALDRVIHDSTSQNDWPVIFANALL